MLCLWFHYERNIKSNKYRSTRINSFVSSLTTLTKFRGSIRLISLKVSNTNYRCQTYKIHIDYISSKYLMLRIFWFFWLYVFFCSHINAYCIQVYSTNTILCTWTPLWFLLYFSFYTIIDIILSFFALVWFWKCIYIVYSIYCIRAIEFTGHVKTDKIYNCLATMQMCLLLHILLHLHKLATDPTTVCILISFFFFFFFFC